MVKRIEHDAKRVKIATAVHLLCVEKLFGRHVDGRAETLVRPRQVASDEFLGETEVAEFRNTVRGHQHVARLDVPMNEFRVMDDLERFRQREDDLDRFFLGKPAAALEQRSQRFSGDVLHDHVVGAVLLAGGERTHEIRMLQLCADAAFAEEALDGNRVASESRMKDLDGDEFSALIAREEDRSCRPLADGLNDSVTGFEKIGDDRFRVAAPRRGAVGDRLCFDRRHQRNASGRDDRNRPARRLNFILKSSKFAETAKEMSSVKRFSRPPGRQVEGVGR